LRHRVLLVSAEFVCGGADHRAEEDGVRRRSACDVTDASASADFNKIAGVRNSGSFRRSLFRRRRHRRSDQTSASGSGTSQIHPSHSDASINSGGSGLTADGKPCLICVRLSVCVCHLCFQFIDLLNISFSSYLFSLVLVLFDAV